MDPIEFLVRNPPFDALDDRELDILRRSLEIVVLPPGHRILTRAGVVTEHLYVIRKGTARLENDGIVIMVLDEGETFGAPTTIVEAQASLDVVADEELLAYRLPRATVERLLQNRDFNSFFTARLAERLRRTAERLRDTPSGAGLTGPIGDLIARNLVTVAEDASVGDAARVMRAERVTSVIVGTDPPGILTDRDLRNRVLAEGSGPDRRAATTMSMPLETMDAGAPVFEALLFMLERNIHHLPLVRDGALVGLVSSTDILRVRGRTPLFVVGALQRAESPADLVGHDRTISEVVAGLRREGAGAIEICRTVSAINDALVNRVLALAERELGPPPSSYAWLVMGSEGRREQALLTDQDNALVFSDGVAPGYFAHLASFVVEALVVAGFPRCTGGYMATRHCHSLSGWIRRFEQWQSTPDPHALLDVSLFFDFRRTGGDLDLKDLNDAVGHARDRGLFLGAMARAVQSFRPPLRSFNRLRGEGGRLDLKRGGIAPIVALARLYALETGTSARSTLDRLSAARAAGTIGDDAAETLAEAFRFLLELRLEHQLRDVGAGRAPTNTVDLDALTHLDRGYLKETFVAVRDAQAAVALSHGTGM